MSNYSFEQRIEEAKKLTRKERSKKNKAMWAKMSPSAKKKFTGDVAMPTAPESAKKKYGTAKVETTESVSKHDLPNTGKKSLFKSRMVKADKRGRTKPTPVSGKRPIISFDESMATQSMVSLQDFLFEMEMTKFSELLTTAMDSLNQSRRRRLKEDEKWYEAAYSVGVTAAEEGYSTKQVEQWIKNWYSLFLQESGGKKVMTVQELTKVAVNGYNQFESGRYDAQFD